MDRGRLDSGIRLTPTSATLKPGESRLLSLPLEIRDLIYEHALVASEPLVIHYEQLKPDADRTRRWDKNQYTVSKDLKGVCSSLIMVCRTIAAEATRHFYGKNTFQFLTEHDYKYERVWLQSIGAVNRGHLTSLWIDVNRPIQAWQCRDGTREGLEYGNHEFDQFNARHPLLQRPPRTYFGRRTRHWNKGFVDDIDPDMVAMFSILGNTRPDGRPAITLRLNDICRGGWPGLDLENQEIMDMFVRFGTDLPNLVEAWRVMYSIHRVIEVIWCMECYPGEGDSFATRLIDSDWFIDKREHNETTNTDVFHCRRRPHPGPIIADYAWQDINEYGRYLPDETNAANFGLYVCEAQNMHKQGEECVCAEHGYEDSKTSLAPSQPVWPAIPTE